MLLAKIMQNMKQNIYIRPYILQNRYILPYKYKQQYKLQNISVISYKKPDYKYNYSIIHYKPKILSSEPIIHIPYKQLYNSIITYKYTKIIIGTTITSFIIYESLYNYIIYCNINTLFSL